MKDPETDPSLEDEKAVDFSRTRLINLSTLDEDKKELLRELGWGSEGEEEGNLFFIRTMGNAQATTRLFETLADCGVKLNEQARRLHPLADLESKLPEGERMQGKEGQEEAPWQDRIKRQVGIDRQHKLPIEVLVHPDVRPEITALAVSQGMATQRYIERLIVNKVNENPVSVKKGKEYIKHAKGNIRRAIIHAQEDIADRLHDLETPPTSSRDR